MLYLSLKKVLTGSEGPQKSLNTFEGLNCLISIAMQGPEHNSETISWKRKKTEKKLNSGFQQGLYFSSKQGPNLQDRNN